MKLFRCGKRENRSYKITSDSVSIFGTNYPQPIIVIEGQIHLKHALYQMIEFILQDFEDEKGTNKFFVEIEV
jgi:hypothetical protein